ncbi:MULTISPECIES: hypothetical protein [unclassified Pseudomonas]|uniref:hypothetical protein n=1 Tax=unclassified Pseudomonas TaxID=196821 RepID=UPI000A1F9D33|nr:MULTISPECIES: hypothetical protein [unclassified Pseudomonas]
MCRVKANSPEDKPIGSIIEPCEKTGVLCIRVYDDKDQLVDGVFLRIREEQSTEHTEFELNSSEEGSFVSQPTRYFQKGGLPEGNYEVFLVKKAGMEFSPTRSTNKFEIVPGCHSVIDLAFMPEIQGSIQDFIDIPILENRELMSQMEADIPDDATKMYCSDQCIDFPTLLERLNQNTPSENSEITLLGVHHIMPFSIFNELRTAFDVVDYSRTSTRLGVSPVDLDSFLGGMHDKAMQVVFLVPPKPRSQPHKRTSQEFIWYNENPVCKAHVTFVFGSYNVVSQENIDLYLKGDDQSTRKRHLFRQYAQSLKPQPPCPEETRERFRLAREEFESYKNLLAHVEANDGEEIDIDSL